MSYPTQAGGRRMTSDRLKLAGRSLVIVMVPAIGLVVIGHALGSVLEPMTGTRWVLPLAGGIYASLVVFLRHRKGLGRRRGIPVLTAAASAAGLATALMLFWGLS